MPPRTVLVVSDGTGDTAHALVLAGVRQFASEGVQLRTYPMVDSVEALERVFRLAKELRALVATTLVSGHMRTSANRLSLEHGVPHLELLGPLIGTFATFLGRAPDEVPGRLHRADEHYFRRIEAIEFTLRADDGKDPRLINEADIVLVGVSRTGKTPLSTFLAHKGYKVANQPIVLDRPLPPQLFQVDQRKIFGLVISPEALRDIRKSRIEAMHMSGETNYCDLGYILAELEYAQDMIHGNMWPAIEVTKKAIEETAATIFRLMQEQGLGHPVGEVSQLG